MSHFSDSLIAETCRGKNCHRCTTRDKMVKASVVHRQPNRRGWYCEACASWLMRTLTPPTP